MNVTASAVDLNQLHSGGTLGSLIVGAVVRFGDRPVLALAPTPPATSLPALPEAGFSLEAHVAEIERTHLAAALQQANGVRTKAADLLGMSFRSFRYYAKKYGL